MGDTVYITNLLSLVALMDDGGAKLDIERITVDQARERAAGRQVAMAVAPIYYAAAQGVLSGALLAGRIMQDLQPTGTKEGEEALVGLATFLERLDVGSEVLVGEIYAEVVDPEKRPARVLGKAMPGKVKKELKLSVQWYQVTCLALHAAPIRIEIAQ